MRSTVFCLLAIVLPLTHSQAQVPIFKTSKADSSVTFSVKASVALAGKFDKWTSSLKFTSPDATKAVLDLKIDAASVDTGSGMKNNKLKSKDFFSVEQYPSITFRSTKVVQTGPATFDVTGDFSIRGVSKPETLNLTISGKGTGSGAIKGTMVFDRNDYGMTKGIPFVKIADHVEVTVDLAVTQVSGPALIYKK